MTLQKYCRELSINVDRNGEEKPINDLENTRNML